MSLATLTPRCSRGGTTVFPWVLLRNYPLHIEGPMHSSLGSIVRGGPFCSINTIQCPAFKIWIVMQLLLGRKRGRNAVKRGRGANLCNHCHSWYFFPVHRLAGNLLPTTKIGGNWAPWQVISRCTYVPYVYIGTYRYCDLMTSLDWRTYLPTVGRSSHASHVHHSKCHNIPPHCNGGCIDVSYVHIGGVFVEKRGQIRRLGEGVDRCVASAFFFWFSSLC